MQVQAVHHANGVALQLQDMPLGDSLVRCFHGEGYGGLELAALDPSNGLHWCDLLQPVQHPCGLDAPGMKNQIDSLKGAGHLLRDLGRDAWDPGV